MKRYLENIWDSLGGPVLEDIGSTATIMCGSGHVLSLLAAPTKGFSPSQKFFRHLNPAAPCISRRHCDTQGQINTKVQCCLTSPRGKQYLRAHLEMEFLFCSGP